MLRLRLLILFMISLCLAACLVSTPAQTPQPLPTRLDSATATLEASVHTGSPTPAGGTLTIFAASSLTDVLPDLAEGFRVTHPQATITFNFGGSQQLVQQLIQGAPADLFISADRQQIEAASRAGIADAAEAVALAGNSLVVVTPVDNPAQIQNFQELATPGIKLVIAAAEAPVGNYTQEFLDKASANPKLGAEFKNQVLANVVSYEENVRAVLNKVVLGEVDAGIVFLSDAMTAGPTQVLMLEIPQEFNINATCWATPLSNSNQGALVHQFLDFIVSEEGQLILIKRGFLPVQ